VALTKVAIASVALAVRNAKNRLPPLLVLEEVSIFNFQFLRGWGGGLSRRPRLRLPGSYSVGIVVQLMHLCFLMRAILIALPNFDHQGESLIFEQNFP